MSKLINTKKFKIILIFLLLFFLAGFSLMLNRIGYFMPKDAKPVSDAEKNLFLEGDMFAYNLSISFKAAGNKTFQDVNLFVRNEDAYILLPSYADLSNIRYHKLNSFYTISLDGKTLENNSLVDITQGNSDPVLTVTGREITKERIREKTREYSLHILKSDNLPAIFINTASGSMDYINETKGNFEKGSLVSIDEAGNVINIADIDELKGHGQISFTYPKRPYSIHFSEDTNLLGMGFSKSYLLQGNWFDPSRLRNATAFMMAQTLNMPYTSKYQYADMYFNGSYYGNYLIEEPIEVCADRINIDKSEDFLFEIVYLPERLDERRIHYTNPYSGYNWEIKYPKADKLDKNSADKAFDQICKINGLIDSFNEDVDDEITANESVENMGSAPELCKLIDEDSFISGYLFDFLIDNTDTGRASTFFTYDTSTAILSYGPVWDYDKSMGIETKCKNPANLSIYFNTVDAPLVHNQYFRNKISNMLDGRRSAIENVINNEIFNLYNQNKASIAMDSIIWDELSNKAVIFDSYEENTEYLVSFLNNRYQLLTDYLANPDAYANVYINDKNGRFYTLKRGERIPEDSISQMIFFSQCNKLVTEDGNKLDSNTVINEDIVVYAK